MACKFAILLGMLCHTCILNAQLLNGYKTRILSNGLEDNKLVRNHTAIYYVHFSKKYISGYITVDRIIEYANRDQPDPYSTYISTDTLLDFYGMIEKGKKDGTFLEFPQGNIFYVHTYRNNEQIGPFEGYYYTGQIYCKGYYSKGEKTGNYEQYYANGKLAMFRKTTGNIDNLVYQEVFYQNGQLESRGSYYNSKKVNEWLYYDYEGNLLKTEYYSNKGRLVKIK